MTDFGFGFGGFGTRCCRPDAELPGMDQSVNPGVDPEADPLGRPRRRAGLLTWMEIA